MEITRRRFGTIVPLTGGFGLIPLMGAADASLKTDGAEAHSAPIGIENTSAEGERRILDFMNDAGRFGSGRFLDYGFLEELRIFENRLIDLRMELEQRLDAFAGVSE